MGKIGTTLVHVFRIEMIVAKIRRKCCCPSQGLKHCKTQLLDVDDHENKDDVRANTSVSLNGASMKVERVNLRGCN